MAEALARLVARARAASPLLALALAFVVVTAPAAGLAQSTGGSFGGGDFSRRRSSSSGGSGGSSGGSTSSGSRSTRWSSSQRSQSSDDFAERSTSSTPPTPVDDATLGWVLFGLVLLGVAAVVFKARKSDAQGAGRLDSYASYVDASHHVDVPDWMFLSQITLGVDWRARRYLQEQLARLAASGQTGTREGRALLLRETILALRRVELAWLYAASTDDGAPLDGSRAQTAFQSASSEARARFRQEVVRNADGTLVQNPTPELRARASEGQGTVVVSLLVVARRGLRTIANLGDAAQIRAALDERAALDADTLVALEVVWSPAAENDRMSTAELEQNYPELRLIDPHSIAGRVFCRYCNGPFARELGTCPHCGAPAPKVDQGEEQGPGPARLGHG